MSGGDPADDWFDDQHSADNKEEVNQHWESARFLLHMTEEHSLRHAGVDSFCDSTQWFVEKVCSQISKRVERRIVYVTLFNVHVCHLQVCFITHWGIFGQCFVHVFKQYN